MFKKINKNSTQSSAARSKTVRSEASVSDPWEAGSPEPHVPTPIDRLLSPEHALISAAASYPAIAAVEPPTALFPPAGRESATATNPVAILLQNELKLSSSFESLQEQIGKALAFLDWGMKTTEKQ